MKHRLAMAGALIILSMIVFSTVAPLVCPHRPEDIDIGNYLLPPSSQHWLGTDMLGRDLFSRMAYGARVSLWVGFVSVGIAVLIGGVVGTAAGYCGGRIDAVLMRLVDVMLCFPAFFLILALIAMFDPSIFLIMAVIGTTSWMGIARLLRAEILSLKEREFVLAARAAGVPGLKIVLRHLVPNALGPVIVSATLGVAAAILTESSLSFLGLGVQPPTPSWGNILTDAKACLGIAWWMSLFPGLAIFITVLGYNLVGEGLRDVLITRER